MFQLTGDNSWMKDLWTTSCPSHGFITIVLTATVRTSFSYCCCLCFLLLALLIMILLPNAKAQILQLPNPSLDFQLAIFARVLRNLPPHIRQSPAPSPTCHSGSAPTPAAIPAPKLSLGYFGPLVALIAPMSKAKQFTRVAVRPALHMRTPALPVPPSPKMIGSGLPMQRLTGSLMGMWK